ncbi:uncharacterized protein [Primulina eburnea]|uniref:uncharacterized protein isoform X2 n=1 Tax=Primulina eburnea TaxID=1245227 RepID=UPI003C6C0629
MKISSDKKMADSGTEESSWTFYIQGFMCDDAQNSSSSSDYETPSLVSDAGSSAAKKLTDIHRTDTNLGFPNGIRGNNHDTDNKMMGKNISIMCKQNSFKKQKTKVPAAVMDYDLEDTASSPANSPKAKRNIFGKGGALNDHHVEKESNSTGLEEEDL